MNLTDLPIDILVLLPSHLHNVEDFANLSSSCRLFHSIYANTSPELILQLAAASTSTFFSPSPHFLVAATARQLGEWALRNDDNLRALEASFQGGIDGIYRLCLKHSSLSIERIRELHVSRCNVIDPFADRIRDPEMLEIRPASVRATYQLIILGELFSRTVTTILDPSSPSPRITLMQRLEFIKYCIPDGSCLATKGGPVVQAIGPYAPENLPRLPWDQKTLHRVLVCAHRAELWTKFWMQAIPVAGSIFSQSWRNELWMEALLCQGFDTAELLIQRGDISPQALGRLLKVTQQIATLDDEWKPPGDYGAVGSMFKLSDWPRLATEMEAWRISARLRKQSKSASLE
ncbi:hypothetical protein PT974_06905 [Cladobotryum mycophilum]|uniref:F-box domain-containing protein n=1 Tax=Cladobotryum mycophilum TaxID=491253 RepID=A0ABR0SMS9_9HYPO